jgi:voltage-gated potassium channel
MDFTRQAGVAVTLVTLTLCLQCVGTAVLINWARKSIERGIKRFTQWQSSVLMIRFSTALIILHFVEIFLWAGFYRWHCLTTWESSFYFSATSYSTVGYGDLVLPHAWRLLGPVESVAGVLMSGISVSVLFAILVRLVQSDDKSSGKAMGGGFEDQPREAVSVNEIG